LTFLCGLSIFLTLPDVTKSVSTKEKDVLDFMDFADFFVEFSVFINRQFLFLFHVFSFLICYLV